MNRQQKNLKEFHEKFGFTINKVPTLIDKELGLVRHKHTSKELDELEKAIKEDDLIGIADALGDLKYFIDGTGVAYGIDLEEIENEIHRSNMTKDRPYPFQYVDAKAVKGKNYSPPNLKAIIESQTKKGD